MRFKPLPTFDSGPPRGYFWLIERDLVRFDAGGKLESWHYLGREDTFVVNKRWPDGPSSVTLVAFARRQDNDDLACFELGENGVNAAVLIHGWTPEGYTILARYTDFWDWVKSVIDDIAEWNRLDPMLSSKYSKSLGSGREH